jgi:DNA repair exonuclease SbcCD ATPase subunit
MSILMKKVRWKNFLSTGNNFNEISLNKHKTTSVSGENGSGKTTMIEAIIFALFGKPYRNINIPQLPNSINKKDCLVELYFDIGKNSYKIRRGLNPKIFEIYLNNVLIDQDSKSKDYQKMLEEQILRMNFKSFCQVVILGSTNYIPFMKLTASERRNVVENLLDINVFSTMNTLLKGKTSQLSENSRIVDSKLEILKEKVELQKKYIEKIKERETQVFEEKRIRVEELKKEAQELKNKIQKSKLELEQLDSLIEIKEEIQDKINKLNSEILSLNKSLTRIIKEQSAVSGLSVCPTCTQDIDIKTKNKLNKSKQNEIDSIQTEILRIEKELEDLQNQKKEIQKYENTRNEVLLKFNKISNNIESNEKTIAALEKEIKSINSQQSLVEEAEANMNQYIGEGKVLFREKAEIIDDLHYCKIASLILKDSGIKSKIIKHYLPIMNKIINRYLSEMNFFIQFELDEEFKETIKSRNRDVFSYENFSEGEKRKIDLALLFAWRKISQIKNSLNCNLLIFDEILDGSLDDNATKLLLSILQIIDKDSNIFVISHKSKDILQDKFEHNITFSKKKNFSKVSQD